MKKALFVLAIVCLLLAGLLGARQLQPPQALSVYDLCLRGTEIERQADRLHIQVERRLPPVAVQNFLTRTQTDPLLALLKTSMVIPESPNSCPDAENIRYIITIRYGKNQLALTFGCLERGNVHYHLDGAAEVYAQLDALCQG